MKMPRGLAPVHWMTLFSILSNVLPRPMLSQHDNHRFKIPTSQLDANCSRFSRPGGIHIANIQLITE